MMKKLILLITFLKLISCDLLAQNFETSDSLAVKLLWKTDQVLQTPESVFFDESRSMIYVANIAGIPLEKDHNGFISKLSANGDIIELEWIKGLNAPKGMAISGTKLFVADIDRLTEIDIISAKIEKFHAAPDAKFLNDVAVDQMGTIYFSDTQKNTIYRLINGKVEKWLETDVLKGVNGLFVEDGYLLAGTRNGIYKIKLSDRKASLYIKNTGSIDGLQIFSEKAYLYSDWSGHVYIQELDKQKRVVLSTVELEINAADIYYAPSKNLLLVPTFHDNRVMAYELLPVK